MHPLDPLFVPRSVAVVGASSNPGKITGRPLANLLRHRFAGRLHPVNPAVESIDGVRCWPSIEAIPDAIDAAFMAVPAAEVPAVLRACAARGARAAVVYSSGFAESGPEGVQRQADLVALARELGIRVAGPNCLGIVNARDRVMLTAATAPTELPLPAGRIGLVSQSGALASACMSRGAERGIAVRYAVASGNEADIDLSEYLDWMLRDPEVRVLAALVEGIRQPRRFMVVCREAARRGVPVVMCRLGRSEVGQRAAASHTGSMLGDEQAFLALARQLGVVFVEDIDTMMESAHLLCRGAGGAAAGGGVAIVSHSGGGAILATDLLSEHGVALAEFAPATRRALTGLLPDWGTAQNPLDLTTAGLADGSLVARALRAVADDPGVAATVMVLSNTAARSPVQQAALAGFDRDSDKPFAAYCVDGVARKSLQPLREAGTAVYDSATSLAQSLRAVLAWQAGRAGTEAFLRRALPDDTPSVPAALPLPPAALPSAPADAPGATQPADWPAVALPAGMTPVPIPDDWLARLRALRAGPGTPSAGLTEPEAKSLLALAGIAVPAGRFARDARQAQEAADSIGYPVVLKLVAAGVSHKSELGGVALDLRDRAAVAAAHAGIVERAAAAGKAAATQGVWVERMAPAAAELIIGVRWSRDFGPMALVGMGGIYAELLHDVAIRPAPVTEDEAMAMLRSLAGHPMLAGLRGRPPVDLPAAARALSDLTRLAVGTLGLLPEIEINPLGVGRLGEGAWALDAVAA